MCVGDVDVNVFVDVHRRGLGDQQPAGSETDGDPLRKGARIAADADVAVHEQDGAPAPLAGQRVEDGAAILQAEGQSRAIDEVFQAVHRNDPDPKLLAYQYLQTLPQLAQGSGNNFWVIPSEITSALQGVSRAFTEVLPQSPATREKPPDDMVAQAASDKAQAEEAAAAALADAAEAEGTNPDALPHHPPR